MNTKLTILTLLSLFLISCGGGSSSSSSDNNNNQTLITEITLSGDNFILSGTTTTLTATITPENASNQNLNWSSSNEEVATVTNGLVTALSAGTVTITVAARDNSGATASILITVQAEAVLITAITINSTRTITVGNTSQLSATIIPNDATNQNLNWSSSNEEVATVNNNGIVTAISVGTATITATATDSSGITASTNITVAPIYITNISISGNNTITVGNTTQLTTVVTPNDATNQNLIWSSSDEAVATVNNNGVVTAINPGEVTITTAATDGSGITRSINITVAPIYITNIIINGNNTIAVGSKATLSATITPNDAANQNLNWSSSNEEVATVNNNGVVTALNQGELTITAAATDGSGVSGEFVITVVSELVPVVTNFTTELLIDAINIGDTIGTITITNSPTIVTILEDPNGYDQHFNIDANGHLTIAQQLLTITYTLQVQATNDFGTTIGNLTITVSEIKELAKLIANDSANENRFGRSVAVYNNYMLIGAPGPSNADIPGYAYLFKVNETTKEVTELAKLIAADGANNDRFGTSVALNNNYALIGTHFHDHSNLTNNGAAYLFDITNITPNTTITHTTKLVANNGSDDDNFGRSVALNNNYALIGASNKGAAYLFDITDIIPNTIITHTTKLVANDGGSSDNFGISVALNNNYALIGANSHDHSSVSNNGAAYLFDITDITPNTTITHTTKLVANDGGGGDSFGTSVALNNDYALIGAYLHDHSNLTRNGAAYLFAITDIIPNTAITHTTKLIANDGGSADYFGISVALNNNYALIGAYFHDHSNLADNGAAYLFDLSNITPNTTSAHTTKLVANDAGSFDDFGTSVALNNNYALIGSYSHDHSNLDDNGAAYIFGTSEALTIPVHNINITGTATITVNTTAQLNATIIPETATKQNLNWSSSNEEIATVNNTGLVTALSPGAATITAAATDGSSVTRSTNITVEPRYAITTININGASTITVGDTTQLTTLVTPNDATNKNLTWSSSNNNIATVNNNGLVTALNLGELTITATATDGSGITASINITVEPRYITSINISGNNTIAIGSKTTLSATITPNNATNQNLNWSSSDEEVATVINGLVTALNAGTATITAAATDGSGVNDDFVISVVDQSVPVVTNFTTELLIDAVSVGDTIGTITITNSPTIVTILADPNGYDQHFNINESGRLTVAQQLLTITYTLQVQATNDFGTTIGNLTIIVYEINELAKLIAGDSVSEDRFGGSVAIYNNYMLIGAPGTNSANIPGYAYLFKINETTREITQLAKLLVADGANDDRFGNSVAIYNNYMLIGAPGTDTVNTPGYGYAYLFKINETTGEITQLAKLIAADEAKGDQFGISVALNDNYALIGANWHNHSNSSNNGAAYLFDITNIVPNTTITHTTKLVANDGRSFDYFGISVALNNNYALIGADRHDHSGLFENGAAYLFDITNITPNTIITHTTKLIANNGGDGDRFGISVALNNNYVLIGSHQHNHSNLDGNGAAYLFDITGITPNTIITHTTKLIANDGGSADYFGISVALNNNYALIGAYFHDYSGLSNNGAAYLFDITGITPNTTITHTTKLVANNGSDDDNFGISVALDDNYALIGADGHDHSGSTDNGAAYVFDL